MLTARWQQGVGRLAEVSNRKEARMITLYGFGAGFGLPEKSPFVTKTEVQLKMAGLDYCKRLALPPASPKGQMPFIEDDGEQIADSTFIRAHIEGKYGFDFDAGLSPLQRAQAWTVERMVEHHVYSAMIGARWLDPNNFARGPAHFFDAAPEAAREAIRANAQVRVAETYRLGGLGRHDPEEALGLVARSLSALSQLLAGNRYLMGERPCGTDATVFGMVAGILTPFFESSLRRRAEQFENLNAYADRMMAQFYPEHPWSEQERAA
jgi:glutathione S-transferase